MRLRFLLLAATLAACTPERAATQPPPGDGGGGAGGAPGTCARFGDAERLGAVEDPALDELSGLAVSRAHDGVLWALEDSGNEPELYALDRAGRTRATVRLEGAANVDFEDLALGPCAAGTCLFVADVGDNARARADVSILVLPEPAADRDGAARPVRYPFRYPDGAQDAEALVVGPDGLPIVLTKRDDATTRLYRLPVLDERRTVEAEALGTLSTGAFAGLLGALTAADLSESGELLVLRTYGGGVAYRLPGGIAAPGAAVGPAELPVAAEPQGEAIALEPGGRGFVQVGEQKRAPIFAAPCLR